MKGEQASERPTPGGDAAARERARSLPPGRPSDARILSLIDHAVITLDADGRVALWNPAATALFGIPTDAASGRRALELGLARDLAPLETAVASVLHGGGALVLEGVAVDGPDGRARHVRFRLFPLPAEDRGRGVLVLAADETEERKRIEQLARQKLAVESLNAALRRQAQALVERHRELETKNDLVAAASRAKSEFIANMSHELRTPLNSIRGFCRLLRDGRATENEGREFLDIIDRNGQELLALIDDILELAKADAGRLHVEPETVSPVHVANDIADELKPLAREKGIALRVEVVGDGRAIATDPQKLQRILRNLVANGIKFTHQGSVVIRVRASQLGGVGIDVIDSGIGVAPGDQARIWNAFEQVDGSKSRRYSGTGLGLSIVRRLVNLLGGTITLQSTPGSGSTFSIELPEEPPATPPPLPLLAAPADGEGVRPSEARTDAGVVLVASADASAFRALDRALCRVELAASWEPDAGELLPRARELAERRRLAATVVDLAGDLPEERALLERLASEPLVARAPVFALVPGNVEEARLVAGATECFAQPVDARKLAQRIAAAIWRRPGSERFRATPPAAATPVEGARPRATPPAADTTTAATPPTERASLGAAAKAPGAPPASGPTAPPLPPRGRATPPATPGLGKRPLSARLGRVPPDALAGRSILVVEDNEDSARLAQLLLEARGCNVTLAPDAGQALALLQKREPDAVIMDLMLPGLDGYEATRAIRSMPERAHVPVVAATAAVLPGDKARALEAGCDDIVAKPYDADELVARVTFAIEARRRERVGPSAGGPTGSPAGVTPGGRT